MIFRLVESSLYVIGRIEGKKNINVCKTDDLWDYMEEEDILSNLDREERDNVWLSSDEE